jgi:hypothetical protein
MIDGNAIPTSKTTTRNRIMSKRTAFLTDWELGCRVLDVIWNSFGYPYECVSDDEWNETIDLARAADAIFITQPDKYVEEWIDSRIITFAARVFRDSGCIGLLKSGIGRKIG